MLNIFIALGFIVFITVIASISIAVWAFVYGASVGIREDAGKTDER